jgi:hypothetical protein
MGHPGIPRHAFNISSMRRCSVFEMLIGTAAAGCIAAGVMLAQLRVKRGCSKSRVKGLFRRVETVQETLTVTLGHHVLYEYVSSCSQEESYLATRLLEISQVLQTVISPQEIIAKFLNGVWFHVSERRALSKAGSSNGLQAPPNHRRLGSPQRASPNTKNQP